MIYADYAATSGYVFPSVIEKVTECMLHPGNPGRGCHESAIGADRIVYEAREKTAHFFDADSPSDVVFTSGITMSLNIVIKGILKSSDHVVTTYAEHNSVLRPLYEMEQKGVRLSIVSPEINAIARAVRPDTKAVVMTCASNVTGDVYDFRSVGKYCREHGIIFIVDTAQYAGIFPLSMKKDYIDILCFTGHKGLMGPQGIGGICVGKEIKIRPLVTGGSGVHSYSGTHPEMMPTALEAGTLNTPGIAGFCAAIRETEKLSDSGRALWLAGKFYNGIRNIPGIKLYGNYSDTSNRTPVVAFNIADYDSGAVSDELEQRFGIATRPGAHCAPCGSGT